MTEEPKNLRADVTLQKSQGSDGEEAPPPCGSTRRTPRTTPTAHRHLVAGRGAARARSARGGLAGVYRSTEPLPIDGGAKVLVRLHKDRALLGLPVRAPEDAAIPAPAIEAPQSFSREFADKTEFLQRELKDDVPGWLWPAASLLVFTLARLHSEPGLGPRARRPQRDGRAAAGDAAPRRPHGGPNTDARVSEAPSRADELRGLGKLAVDGFRGGIDTTGTSTWGSRNVPSAPPGRGRPAQCTTRSPRACTRRYAASGRWWEPPARPPRRSPTGRASRRCPHRHAARRPSPP